MLRTINSFHLDTAIKNQADNSVDLASKPACNLIEKLYGIKPLFKNEQFYLPRNNVLFGRNAQLALIATMDNYIYKIYYRFDCPNRENFDNLRHSIIDHLSTRMPVELLENPSVQDLSPDIRLLIWKFEWGNLLLEIGPLFNIGYAITSSRVRGSSPPGFFNRLFGG